MQIAITGPESSGKTTLSIDLAAALSCPFVPEFARTYLSFYKKEYTKEDVLSMAKGQALWIKWFLENKNNEHLVFDTELSVFRIWTKVRYGYEFPRILELFKENTPDLYVLCSPDIPWEADELREHPNKRKELFENYIQLLSSQITPYIVVGGTPIERLETCLDYISTRKI